MFSVARRICLAALMKLSARLMAISLFLWIELEMEFV